MYVGAVAVPLNYQQNPNGVRKQAQFVDADLIMTDANHIQNLSEQFADIGIAVGGLAGAGRDRIIHQSTE